MTGILSVDEVAYKRANTGCLLDPESARSLCDSHEALRAALEAAEAEATRLREALTELADCVWGGPAEDAQWDAVKAAVDAALAAAPPEGEDRCPTCGSNDPDRCGHGVLNGDVCCPDSWHQEDR